MARSREDEFGGAPLPQLLCGESALDKLEARNGIVLALYISELADKWQNEFHFTPEIIQTCNAIAMNGIYACAGQYRNRCVIAGDFVGAHHKDIPRLIDEMCVYLNSCTGDPYHAAAYVLWRTSWIHPFYNGNGRVSRELCYLAVMVGLGRPDLEGENPIPVLLKNATDEYMRCLRVADTLRLDDDRPNLGPLESLLCALSDEQSA